MVSYADVEQIIIDHLDQTAPAISLAVFLHGDLIVERAYGYIDPDTRMRPVLPDTLFDLASVTKLYTTTGFLMQVAKGNVALDDPVVSIIPEFAGDGPRSIEGAQNPHTLEREPAITSGSVDPTSITFRQLLTHTSGLPPWRDLFLNLGATPAPPDTADPIMHHERLNKALKLIAGYGFICPPGTAVHYSDLGLILLGTALARLHGYQLDETIEGLVERNVLYNPDPGDCVPTEYDERWRKRRVIGEVHDENACALGGIAGHAGLFATAYTVGQLGVRWLEAIDGGSGWLLPEIANDAVRPHVEDRGLGWMIRSPEGSSSGQYFSPNSFGHTGFTGTSLWVDPQRSLVVALLTNRVYYGRDAMAIMQFRPQIHDAIIQWVDAL